MEDPMIEATPELEARSYDQKYIAALEAERDALQSEEVSALFKDKVSDIIFAAIEQHRVDYLKSGLGAMAEDCDQAALAFRKAYLLFRPGG